VYDVSAGSIVKIRFGVLVTLSILMLNSSSMSSAVHNTGKFLVYLGAYGDGVHAFRFDADSGQLEPLGLVGKITNPSWLTTDREYRHLYAVSELDGDKKGDVAAFALDRGSGQLRPLNQVSSQGVAPCHASVDKTASTLVVANYTTGEVSAFPLKQDGKLDESSAVEKAHGSSVNKQRQEGPHAHAAVITADNKRVYVPDLGLDEIRIYRLDPTTGKLSPNDPPVVKGEPGLGPRHLVFDRKGAYAYVINELKPVVSVYSFDHANGNLTLVQTVSTIGADFKNENTGAEVRLDPAGRFLYTSNRGEDSIQVFAVDPVNGKLSQVQNVPSGGKEPRGFALDPTGRFLFVANQKSNKLVLFKVDDHTGKLTPTGQAFETPSPADVLFVPAA
jgi:6-phosphogluconolactonase